ncbi:MAG: glutaredoxin family protein [Pseudomonadota bacterium]
MSDALILYTRRGCHLCGSVADELQAMADAFALTLEPRYVEDHPAWEAAHGHRVPVVVHRGATIDEGRVDVPKVRDYLEGVVGLD